MKNIFLAVTAVMTVLLAVSCEKPGDVRLRTPDLKTIPDGEYRGSYRIFPVTVRVKVAMKNHRIVSVAILEHFNGKGKDGEKITGRIVASQSLEIDAISGATYSSKTILKAVENALEKKEK